MTPLFVLFLVLLLIYAFIQANKRPSRYPKGPFLLPVFGYLPFINKKNPIKTFGRLAKQYGEAFSLRLGIQNAVYLNTWDLAKEAFNHPDIQGRPDFFTFNFTKMGKRRGVAVTDGSVWQEQRRFTIRHLRDFGFGKVSFESIILKEVQSVADRFYKHEGRPFEVSSFLNVAIVNIIWKMVADLELDRNDPSLLMLMESIEKGTETVGATVVLDFLPFFRHFLPESVSGMKNLRYLRNSLYSFIQKLIDDHKDNLDESDPKDFMDVYITRMKEDQQKGVTGTTFTDLQLYGVASDLFVAGSETTSTTLRFAMLFLISNPEVQERLQKDLQILTEGEREVSLNDKNNLPYMEAFIMEVQRLSNITPLGVPHSTTANVTLGNYVIPKGTIVFAQAEYIHMNEKYWPDPEKFDPSRFLCEDGSVNRKMEAYLPFSTGKRQCLGENLAKAELFLFLSNLLQQFTFACPPGSSVPSPLEKSGGLVVHPPIYEMVAIPRKKTD